MPEWSLPDLLASLHEDVATRLATSRKVLAHPDAKGDASESVWAGLLQRYLPKRYQAETAFVVDSNGRFSEQVDVVVFDRQYSPFIFTYEGQTIIPAESVYAVFESKQTINASLVAYAQDKVASVRGLHRTSLPIPHAGGTYDAKLPPPILGGLLAFESDWNPPLGNSLEGALTGGNPDGSLDLGCVAAHGVFSRDVHGAYTLTPGGKPATAFLFELLGRLQACATVPMIDVGAYARWLQ